MKIAIVGAGAMGSLFGGKLSSVADVWLLDFWQEHVKSMQEKGLHIVEPEGEKIISVKATIDPADVPKNIDLVIIFVKSHQTRMATEIASGFLGDNSLVLTLQNGLGNLQIISDIVGKNHALQGVTSHGATILGPGRVLHAGKGPTHLAVRKEISKQMKTIANIFRHAGFEVEISSNLEGIIWGKLIINAGINALTAILRIPNGELLEIKPARELMSKIVNETAEVAKKKGIIIPYDDIQAKVEEVCRKTASNYSSMLQDILRHTKTEIDFINGAIIKEGKRSGIPTPFNYALFSIVKAIEKSYTGRILY